MPLSKLREDWDNIKGNKSQLPIRAENLPKSSHHSSTLGTWSQSRTDRREKALAASSRETERKLKAKGEIQHLLIPEGESLTDKVEMMGTSEWRTEMKDCRRRGRWPKESLGDPATCRSASTGSVLVGTMQSSGRWCLSFLYSLMGQRT